jgi:hypothetical protein
MLRTPRYILGSAFIGAVIGAIWALLFTFHNALTDFFGDLFGVGDYDPARIDYYIFAAFILTLVMSFVLFWILDKYSNRGSWITLGVPLIFVALGFVSLYNFLGFAEFLFQSVNVDDFYFPRVSLGISFFVPVLVYVYAKNNGSK